MVQVIKFPDMRPPKSQAASVSRLPTPAQFRQISPAIITAESRTAPRPVDRRRLLWFGVAVGLHAALFLAIWLTPPLRLQWGPSPDAWVPVVSLPPKISAAPAEPVQAVKPPAAAAKGAHKLAQPAEPRQEQAR